MSNKQHIQRIKSLEAKNIHFSNSRRVQLVTEIKHLQDLLSEIIKKIEEDLNDPKSKNNN